LRRKRILAFTPVLPVLLVAGCSGSSGGTKADIVIAASLEITGPQADVGKAFENALRLRVEQINNGRAEGAAKVTVRVNDNHGDDKTLGQQVTDFANDSSVTAIITGSSTEAITDPAVVDTINKKGVPTISLAPGSGVASPVSARKYLFKLAPNANHDAIELVSSLNTPGLKSVQLVASGDDYGVDAQEAMHSELQKLQATHPGFQLPATLTLSDTDKDYQGMAHAVATAKPDAVIVMAFPDNASKAVAALRGAGYHGHIAFDATAAGPLFFNTVEDNTTLVFTQTLAIDDVIATTPARANQKQWFDDYTARYGSYQAQASFAADAAQVIVETVDKTGSTNHDALRAGLEATNTDGLSGPIRFTGQDHSGLMPQSLTMLVARNGRWRLA
jgi:branched-chain amino acid transport system substrate-binding protein